jgi:RIO kinase 1
VSTKNRIIVDDLGVFHRASPRLKDVEIPAEKYEDLYLDLILTIRKIYHDCKLVHADLSEYNILYHQQQLWIIDVSQSVEHDHPAAFEFLRKDLKNVGDFFGSYGVRCLNLRRAFDFVTSNDIEADSGEDTLKRWLETTDTAEAADDNKPSALEEEAHAHKATEDSVFLKSFIPRNLGEVLNPEQEVERSAQGAEGNLRLGVVGVDRGHAVSENVVDEEEGVSERGEEESSVQDSERDIDTKTPRGHRHEDREAKKVRYIPHYHHDH